MEDSDPKHRKEALLKLIEQVRAILIQTEDTKQRHEIYNQFINECKTNSLTEDDFYKHVLKVAHKSIDWNFIEEESKQREEMKKKLDAELAEKEELIKSAPRYIDRLIKIAFEDGMVDPDELNKIFSKATKLSMDIHTIASRIDALFDEKKYRPYPNAIDSDTLKDILLSTTWYDEQHYSKHKPVVTPLEYRTKEQSSSSKIVAIWIVITCVLGFGGYFIYTKFLNISSEGENKFTFTGQYKCKNKKSYFYDSPDLKTKTAAYLVKDDIITIESVSDDNKFGYGVFTNKKNQQTKGWLILDDLELKEKKENPTISSDQENYKLDPQVKSYPNYIFNGVNYNIFVMKIDKETIKKFDILENRSGLTNQTFVNTLLKSHSSFFLVNACISDSSCNPVGLYVKNSQQLQPINLNDGTGNFYLKPNGGLLFMQDDIIICESSQIYKYSNVWLGIQSGPMLLTDGNLNPQFNQTSINKKIRCGVGSFINNEGLKSLVFCISNTPVSFYDFGVLFHEKFKCRDALCLESVGCEMYFPNLSIKDMYNDKICNYLYLKL